MNEPLDLEIFRKIIALLSRNPGVSLPVMAEQLSIRINLLEMYLDSMIDHQEITLVEEGGVRRCYLARQTGDISQECRMDDVRLRLFGLIVKNPGLHLSKIAEESQMSPPLAKYHLSILEKEHFIISVKDEKGYYVRYYEKNDGVGVNEKYLIALLRQPSVLKIVLLLFKNGRLRHGEIAEKLQVSPSTLSYHLNKLVDESIVVVFSYGVEKGYCLKNEKQIIWLVRKYKLHRIFEGFNELWNDLSLGGEKKKVYE